MHGQPQFTSSTCLESLTMMTDDDTRAVRRMEHFPRVYAFTPQRAAISKAVEVVRARGMPGGVCVCGGGVGGMVGGGGDVCV